jgi:hypothetical protein
MLIIPAQASKPFVLATAPEEHWIPAFAGVTEGAVEVSERLRPLRRVGGSRSLTGARG